MSGIPVDDNTRLALAQKLLPHDFDKDRALTGVLASGFLSLGQKLDDLNASVQALSGALLECRDDEDDDLDENDDDEEDPPQHRLGQPRLD